MKCDDIGMFEILEQGHCREQRSGMEESGATPRRGEDKDWTQRMSPGFPSFPEHSRVMALSHQLTHPKAETCVFTFQMGNKVQGFSQPIFGFWEGVLL